MRRALLKLVSSNVMAFPLILFNILLSFFGPSTVLPHLSCSDDQHSTYYSQCECTVNVDKVGNLDFLPSTLLGSPQQVDPFAYNRSCFTFSQKQLQVPYYLPANTCQLVISNILDNISLYPLLILSYIETHLLQCILSVI